jgi:hypothetical protein
MSCDAINMDRLGSSTGDPHLGSRLMSERSVLASVIISTATAVLVEPLERFLANFNVGQGTGTPIFHPAYRTGLAKLDRLSFRLRSSKYIRPYILPAATTSYPPHHWGLNRLNFEAVLALENTLDGVVELGHCFEYENLIENPALKVRVAQPRQRLTKNPPVGSEPSDQDDVEVEVVFFRNALAHSSFRGETVMSPDGQSMSVLFHFWNFHKERGGQAFYQYAIVDSEDLRQFCHRIAYVIQIQPYLFSLPNLGNAVDDDEDADNEEV